MTLSRQHRLLVLLHLPAVGAVAIGAAFVFSEPANSCSGYIPPLWHVGDVMLKVGAGLTAGALGSDVYLIVKKVYDSRSAGIAIGACMASFLLAGIAVASGLNVCF